MKTFLCLFFVCMSTLASLDAALWKVGEPFPSVTLPTIEGEEGFSLAKFRGQKVMLHVFAAW